MPHLIGLQIGKAEPLCIGRKTEMSAIRKVPIQGAGTLTVLGLSGDEQVSLSDHGGKSKAVYAYPREHFPFWQKRQEACGFDQALPLGSLGENLTIEGLLEEEMFVGDHWHFPNATLTVSEPRFPCAKLSAFLKDPLAVKAMSESGFCGTYLSVHTSGVISAGESFTVEAGPQTMQISQLFRRAMRQL